MNKSTMAKTTDWDAINNLYRTGVLSKREIARQYRISESGLRMHAKKHGWEQDLAKQVQERAYAELQHLEKKQSHTAEAEVIETGAAMIVQVVRNHRNEIAAGRQITKLLLRQLQDVATHRGSIEAEIEAFTEEDEGGARRTSMMRAVALPSNVAVLRDLATTMKTYISLEREAFNIGDGASPEEEKPKELSIVLDFDAIRARCKPLVPSNE